MTNICFKVLNIKWLLLILSLQDVKELFMLPWWFMFITYGFCLAIVAVSFWLCVEVAGVFGAQKASEWLVAFVYSVVQSIFLLQPLKVVILVTFCNIWIWTYILSFHHCFKYRGIEVLCIETIHLCHEDID